MKKQILILLVLISSNLIAQDFAPIGAKWYYTQMTGIFDIETYKTLESIKDTSINGQSCKMLLESIAHEVQDTQYMYSKNDSVFFYEKGTFHLLYDFGAQKGDTIVLDFFKKAGGDPLEMIIDSTSTIEINEISKRIQYISCGDGLVIEFPGPVIEGIGAAPYIFPSYDNNMTVEFRCYQDNILGLFKNPFFGNSGWSKVCDYVYTGGKDILDNKVKLVPNPVSSSFRIQNPKNYSNYILTDLNGKELKKGNIVENHEVNVSELNHGIYILQLNNGSEMVTLKIIKK